jgi:hypothetical protein
MVMELEQEQPQLEQAQPRMMELEQERPTQVPHYSATESAGPLPLFGRREEHDAQPLPFFVMGTCRPLVNRLVRSDA